MPNISKINALDIGNIAKVDGATSSNIAKVDGLDFVTFTGLLDTYTGAAAGYSVRRIASSATNLMRIREDSGDTETDIGYDSNGDLDTAAIATHCGSANGYVVTWYDQANIGGTPNNATQSTASAQPQIYNGTAVITENGKPALDTNTAGQKLIVSSPTTLSQPYTVVGVAAGSLNNPYHSANSRIFQTASNLRLSAQTQMTLSINATPQCLFFAVPNSTSSFLAGSTSTTQTSTTGDAGTDSLALNNTELGNRELFDNGGLQQELIFWDSDQNAAGNRTGIETDINGYFSIF